ncbi:MAG: M48 family metalloprotease [Alphaproteobacteria bacterium]|nr:M48 family metalloprotease [Alphaproteobacteria bacterium]
MDRADGAPLFQSSDESARSTLVPTRRRFLSGLGCACAAGAATGCLSQNRATGRQSFTGFYSLEDDIEIGTREHPKLVAQFGGVYEDRRLQRYVDEIGRRTAAFAEYEFPYRFTIVNSPIVNAFALPGGYVYVSRGLIALASNEAELASVIAHEIGHITARHTAERISQAQLAQVGVGLLGVLSGSGELASGAGQVAQLVLQGHSRDQELEADRLGIRYMTRAGYDPDGSVTFLATLREHSMFQAEFNGRPPGSVDEFDILATHPRTIERVRLAQEQADAVVIDNPLVGRDAHMSAINGVLYGDDPREGVVDGLSFRHPDLRFAYDVPSGFVLRNSPQRVIATNGDGGAIVFDMARSRAGSPMDAYLTRNWAAGVSLSEVERLQINGADAATASARGRGGDGQLVDARFVAIRGDGDRVFRLQFISPVDQTAALSEAYRRTTYSFRRLSRAEAEAIRGKRLITARTQQGDTVRALAGAMPFGEFNERAFRVLNDMTPGQPLPIGELVKIIAS